jgi:hypothetical protein
MTVAPGYLRSAAAPSPTARATLRWFFSTFNRRSSTVPGCCRVQEPVGQRLVAGIEELIPPPIHMACTLASCQRAETLRCTRTATFRAPAPQHVVDDLRARGLRSTHRHRLQPGKTHCQYRSTHRRLVARDDLREVLLERFGISPDDPEPPVSFDPERASRDPEGFTALAAYRHSKPNALLDRQAGIRFPLPPRLSSRTQTTKCAVQPCAPTARRRSCATARRHRRTRPPIKCGTQRLSRPAWRATPRHSAGATRRAGLCRTSCESALRPFGLTTPGRREPLSVWPAEPSFGGRRRHGCAPRRAAYPVVRGIGRRPGTQ